MASDRIENHLWRREGQSLITTLGGTIAAACSRCQSQRNYEFATHSRQIPYCSWNPFDPALIERFGRGMREKFTTGSVPFRKAYLQSLIEVVEVDDHRIRIKASKGVLERAVRRARLCSLFGRRIWSGPPVRQ